MDIEQLVRENIRRLVAYSSARSEFKGSAEVWLDANENPFDTSYNRYPDPLQQQVKAQLSLLKGVAPEKMFLGNGSDEAIDLLVRIFCEPRIDHILTLPPTYGMYQVSADIADVEVRKVNLQPDFQPDVDAILAAVTPHSKLLFICSPNNPTGNRIDPEAIRTLAANFPGITVVDEAYIDFSQGHGALSLLDAFPRLVVMQTFSKAWGMAGIRLGMAFASEQIIGYLNKVKPPYNVNQLTQEAALKALARPEITQKAIQTLLAERERLETALKDSPVIQRVYPSDANFLLVKTPDPGGLYRFFVEQKIVVRNRSGVVLCDGCIRITVGTPDENERLLQALSIYEKNPTP